MRNRLFDYRWFRRREPLPEAMSTVARADSLADAVARARQLEDEATRSFACARCASEDVIRARAVRLQAEIALMRHRVDELQYSYRR